MINFANTALASEVSAHYSAKFAEHGKTASGKDWNGEEIWKLIFSIGSFLIIDLDYGYITLHNCLTNEKASFSYEGVSVFDDLDQVSLQRYQSNVQARFILVGESTQVADFGVKNVIFNVVIGRSDDE
ncbi:hypothetical protein [Polynucleobacter sp. MWH-HuK1]|uniref:hypothetical protein n=1 Tax=Polynucleobacter sp. MWH-HuK1 TaxID=1743158 RepID=UPI001C0B61B7|nr:hypothetical protein [Polynucleobacter sp. MWH-HuK1]MBU3564431.1 hypothetical protein [Polynucleobacter sp. MWH-HuK1]